MIKIGLFILKNGITRLPLVRKIHKARERARWAPRPFFTAAEVELILLNMKRELERNPKLLASLQEAYTKSKNPKK